MGEEEKDLLIVSMAGGKRVELLSPGSKPVELTIVLTPNINKAHYRN